MAPVSPPVRQGQLTGNRIRERRLSLGMKQSELAAEAGISASYLNLIEHNRRRIGGRLLLSIARVLEVEPTALSEGADATVYDALQAAAQDMAMPHALLPETGRIDELAGRYPGWTHLIAAQHKRIAALDAMVEGLRDRINHDPVLADAMHEVLSTVAAIRSTADILVREPDLDHAWRSRFHRNLHEEAERLSTRATALLGHFEKDTTRQARAKSTPYESVEALFEAAGHHFALIEAEGRVAIPQILSQASGMDDPATHALGERMLGHYADDAARLPLSVLLPQAQEAEFDPVALLGRGLGQGDAGLVLRRLATLPTGTSAHPGPPQFGLAVCDGAGALLFRRRLPGFAASRFGSGCPLWPLYRALVRPGQPEMADIEMPKGGRFRTWSVSHPVAQTGFGQTPVMQAVMLITPQEVPEGADVQAGLPAGPPPIAAGPGCHLCAREICAARR